MLRLGAKATSGSFFSFGFPDRKSGSKLNIYYELSHFDVFVMLRLGGY
ncbi:hypothetical protein [Okeania sp. KiyG1]|nr:hypothetical protein [Okeania sp. KiyG1]